MLVKILDENYLNSATEISVMDYDTKHISLHSMLMQLIFTLYDTIHNIQQVFLFFFFFLTDLEKYPANGSARVGKRS